MNTVWLVSEIFGSQEDSTGHLLSDLARGLARDWSVNVVSYPQASNGKPRSPRSPLRRGANGLARSLRLGWRTFRRARSGDVVIVLTNPPTLPVVLAPFGLFKRFRTIVLIHDLYPDIAYTDIRGIPRMAVRLFDRLNTAALQRADRIIVLGRDMQRRVRAKLGNAAPDVHIITNWPDVFAMDETTEDAGPRRQAPFVAQYSGKMGVTHNPDVLLEAAATLQRQGSPVRFDVFAWGAQFDRFQHLIKKTGLQNLRAGGPCPRNMLAAQLADCDVGLILMRRGAAGASVPCRLYNLLAAGKPVIAAVEADSEVAMVLREARVGWVVEPDDAEGLARAITEASLNRAELAEMGARARAIVRAEYSFDHALNAYRRVIAQTIAVPA